MVAGPLLISCFSAACLVLVPSLAEKLELSNREAVSETGRTSKIRMGSRLTDGWVIFTVAELGGAGVRGAPHRSRL